MPKLIKQINNRLKDMQSCTLLLYLFIYITLVFCKDNVGNEFISWSSYEGMEDAPLGYTGHSINSVGERAFIQFGGHIEEWIVGGKNNVTFTNDLYVLNLDTMSWLLIQSQSPAPRAYHQSVYYSRNNQIFMFGGMYFNTYDNITLFNDFWSYDVERNQWSLLGEVPNDVGLSGASVVVIDNCLIVFGGQVYNWYGFPIYTNNTWIYVIDANKWTQLEIGVAPMSRGYAQTFIIERNMYINGGQASDLSTFFIGNPPDTWKWDSDTFDWTMIDNSDYNVLPSRQGSATMQVNNSFTVIYGGQIQSETDKCGYPLSIVSLSDTWYFNAFDDKWYSIIARGSQPLPLLGSASACTPSTQECVITGGIDFNCEQGGSPIHNPFLYILSVDSDPIS